MKRTAVGLRVGSHHWNGATARLALLVGIALVSGACWLATIRDTVYQSGSADVTVSGLPDGPVTTTLPLTDGGYTVGSQQGRDGANAQFQDGQWGVAIQGLVADPAAGVDSAEPAIGLIYGAIDSSDTWAAWGRIGSDCELTQEPGLPGRLAGTAHCTSVPTVHGPVNTVSFDVTFEASAD